MVPMSQCKICRLVNYELENCEIRHGNRFVLTYCTSPFFFFFEFHYRALQSLLPYVALVGYMVSSYLVLVLRSGVQ
jgi:hypothetical protein